MNGRAVNAPWWSSFRGRPAPSASAAAAVAARIPAAAEMPPDSYAQLGQDLAVIAFYGGKRGGYFVDVGAFDGVTISNTVKLERELGWRGICVEPSPSVFDQLRESRSCTCVNVAAYSESGLELEFADAAMQAGIAAHIDTEVGRAAAAESSRVRVKTATLTELLDDAAAPSFIEYLSVDAEGADLEVLRGIDFDRYRFGYISIEHNFIKLRRTEMRALLEGHGYVHQRENGPDDDYALPFDAWYRSGYRSGPGSTEEYTAGFRAFLEAFLRDHGIRSVLDYGCGDWQWARLVNWGESDYTGVDVVPEVVGRLRREYGNERRRFACWPEIPDGQRVVFDLAICKDVLCHLPLLDAMRIASMLQSCARHVLFVYDHADSENVECVRGGYRPLDLTRAPFLVTGEVVYEFPPGPWRKVVVHTGG